VFAHQCAGLTPFLNLAEMGELLLTLSESNPALLWGYRVVTSLSDIQDRKRMLVEGVFIRSCKKAL
jgi:hypothetical protein